MHPLLLSFKNKTNLLLLVLYHRGAIILFEHFWSYNFILSVKYRQHTYIKLCVWFARIIGCILYSLCMCCIYRERFFSSVAHRVVPVTGQAGKVYYSAYQKFFNCKNTRDESFLSLPILFFLFLDWDFYMNLSTLLSYCDIKWTIL